MVGRGGHLSLRPLPFGVRAPLTSADVTIEFLGWTDRLPAWLWRSLPHRRQTAGPEDVDTVLATIHAFGLSAAGENCILEGLLPFLGLSQTYRGLTRSPTPFKFGREISTLRSLRRLFPTWEPQRLTRTSASTAHLIPTQAFLSPDFLRLRRSLTLSTNCPPENHWIQVQVPTSHLNLPWTDGRLCL